MMQDIISKWGELAERLLFTMGSANKKQKRGIAPLF